MVTPNFQSPQTNPFGLSNVANTNGRLAFADIDNDGDLDAFVGQLKSDPYFIRNDGSVSVPLFAPAQTNPFGLIGDVFNDVNNPTFADIDNDGDLDAFFGGPKGDTYFFRNDGSVSAPLFASAQTNPFGLSNVGSAASVPTLVDIDNDGDLDAFVGANDGSIHFFQNNGSASSPSFVPALTNPFGLSDVGYNSSPTFADIDSDGDLDAFVGDFGGNTYFFQNDGSVNNPSFAAVQANPFGLSNVGDRSNSSPTFADIDGDGDLDAFVRTFDRSTYFFENVPTSNVNQIIGTEDDEILNGTPEIDEIQGLGGNDRLDGGAGDDILIGGTGNDVYVIDSAGDVVTEAANEGIDTVRSSITYTLGDNVERLVLTGTSAIDGTGNGLNNQLTGNSAVNTLTGGAGADRLDGKAGEDTLIGGAGNDVYIVDHGNDDIIENAGEGYDTVRSSTSYSLRNNIERVILTGTDDIGSDGNALNNEIIGNSGNNTLYGDTGNDRLTGGSGDDVLFGDEGRDSLFGGAGADEFVIQRSLGFDILLDFKSGEDKIIVVNREFDNIAIGELMDAQFRLGSRATTADQRFIYNKGTGSLLYDADGNGIGGAVVVARLTTLPTLTASDIVVVPFD